jgi:alpha-1,3-rhamnosyl/mannosyltransferase
MRLILGLDALRPPLTGIGQYTRQLASALLDLGEIEHIEGLMGGRIVTQAQLNEFLRTPLSPYGTKTKNVWTSVLASRLRAVPGAYGLRQRLRQYQTGQSLRGVHGAIYHEPNAIACTTALPSIITLHDLSHLHYPQLHPNERVAYLRRQLPHSLLNARHIIVDAQSTRQELIDIFDLPGEQISVIPLGVDPSFHTVNTGPTSSTLERFELRPKHYLLSVGTLEPRKNIERTLQAYTALPEYLRKDFPLVLSGGKGWKDAAIHARLKQIKPPGRVILTGYVDHHDLLALYAACTAFVYPSLYEGFGLPILEGMAAGAPVITSNVSAMPEVAGDAALLIDPNSVDELAAAMQHVLEDQHLAADLSKRGQARARDFTWARTAAQTLDVYRRVLAEF